MGSQLLDAPYKPRSRGKVPRHELVDIEPFRQWWESFGKQFFHPGRGHGWERAGDFVKLASLEEVNPSLARIVNRSLQRGRINIYTVDEIGILADDPGLLERLYPLDEADRSP